MNYYEQSNSRGKVWGIIFLSLYFGACVGVMFLTYTIALPDEPEATILVEFGAIDSGKNDADLALGETDAATMPATQTAVSESVMTTNEPDAPAVVAPPQREVNQRALFPGSNANNTHGATASSQTATSQGSVSGSAGASGSGVEGFDLAGRYGIIPMPLPVHPGNNLSGRVVIRINVDSDGNVTSAAYEPVGSTTDNGQLRAAALTAARRTRFTAAEAEIQTGTITYIFKLN